MFHRTFRREKNGVRDHSRAHQVEIRAFERAISMNKKQESPWPEHPLFPAEEGDEPQRIEFIQVIRHENGKSQMIPRTFRADELQSVEDIFALWGGGYYELQGRRSSIADATKLGRLSGNRRYQIPGASKPLVDGQWEAAGAMGSAAPTPTVATAPGLGELPPTMLQLVPVLAQLYTQAQQAKEAREEREAVRRREEEERRRQDDIRREERTRAESLANNQLMINLSAQSQQTMAAMMTALLSRAGGGTDEFARMADLVLKLKGVAVPDAEAASDDGVLDKLVALAGNAADVVQGAVKLKEGPGALIGPPAPPGSAAAVLGVPQVARPPTGGVPPVVP
jgi:hypothetical protein